MIVQWLKGNFLRRMTLILSLSAVFLLLFTAQKQRVAESQSFGHDTQTYVKMEHCPCSRKIKVMKSKDDFGKEILFNETTCSQDAFNRGNGQKIIGFSFYGDINAEYSKKKGYFEGIMGNLELLPKLYPGWLMRLYFDLDPKDPILSDLCDLACNNNLLDLCHAGKLPGTPMKDARKVFPMNWRFFPTLDPQVSLYVSRDLDSRLNDREVAAVNEWLESGKAFHFMRDHPEHGTPILGSAWGARLDMKFRSDTEMVRGQWRHAWLTAGKEKIMWAERDDYGPDQTFLARFVWPWAKRISLGHDSFFCKKYLYSKGFPTQRKNEPNNFVASVVQEGNGLWVKCPYKCRPKEHKDWDYC